MVEFHLQLVGWSRQENSEGRALVGSGSIAKFPWVKFDDTQGNGKPKTCARTLRGKERIEETGLHVGRNSRAVVGDLEKDLARHGNHAEDDVPGLRGNGLG